MTDTPQVLLAHHLKTLKLPTFLREYDKLARQCATEGADHVRYLVRLTELELIDRERRMVERRIRRKCSFRPWRVCRLCVRSHFMTPLPRFASWDAFNGHLEEQCRNRQGNVLRGHRESIGERFVRDREALKRPLPAPFDACDKQGTRVNSLSLVRYRTNDYSVARRLRPSGSLDPWLCPRGGYRLRRRDHCPTPPFLRPGRYGLRSDPLPAFAGAQDRRPGSGRAASRMGTA